MSENLLQNMIAWKTSFGCADSAVKMIKTYLNQSSKTENILRYVDDMVRTFRGDTKELLDAVKNSIQIFNLQWKQRMTKTVCDFWTCQLTYNRGGGGAIFWTW